MDVGNQLLEKNTMQYNMWKGPHFASSKKMEDSILFHEGFSSFRILWTPLRLNVDTKGCIWDNIRCLKFFCKCCTLNPSCIHILHWSLERSVKQTWTGPTFSTNESAWIVMVTGSQSHMWSGPLPVIYTTIKVLGIREMSSPSPHGHSCKKVMDIVLSTISTSCRNTLHYT